MGAAKEDLGGIAALLERIAALEHQVKLREEQVAIVAHDLRGPLSPLVLLVSSLADDIAAASGTKLEADAIHGRVLAIRHRLEQFVRQLQALLEATRLQTGEIHLDPQDVDLAEVVRQVSADAVAGMRRPPEIRVAGAASLVGHWDRCRIEQIVRNLVGNAVRFGANAPVEITVDGDPDGETAALSVRDHGIGIRPQDHGRIFEKHVRLGPTKGFGLGLWIVRELVQAMGGRITVVSEPGDGAEFRVLLPRGAPGLPRRR